MALLLEWHEFHIIFFGFAHLFACLLETRKMYRVLLLSFQGLSDLGCPLKASIYHKHSNQILKVLIQFAACVVPLEGIQLQ